MVIEDKEKLLTKADALAIFATKEDLASLKADLPARAGFIFWIGQLAAFIGIAHFILK
jgi:hypothetical protein